MAKYAAVAFKFYVSYIDAKNKIRKVLILDNHYFKQEYVHYLTTIFWHYKRLILPFDNNGTNFKKYVNRKSCPSGLNGLGIRSDRFLLILLTFFKQSTSFQISVEKFCLNLQLLQMLWKPITKVFLRKNRFLENAPVGALVS